MRASAINYMSQFRPALTASRQPRMLSNSHTMGLDTVHFGQNRLVRLLPKWAQGSLAAIMLGFAVASASGCGILPPASQAPCGDGSVQMSVDANALPGSVNVVNPGYNVDSNQVGEIFNCNNPSQVYGFVKDGELYLSDPRVPNTNNHPIAKVDGDGFISKYENGQWVKIAYFGDSSITGYYLPKTMDGLYLLKPNGDPDVDHPLGSFDQSSWGSNMDYQDDAMVLVRVLLMTPDGHWNTAALNATPEAAVTVKPVRMIKA